MSSNADNVCLELSVYDFFNVLLKDSRVCTGNPRLTAINLPDGEIAQDPLHMEISVIHYPATSLYLSSNSS
jgi:hypothetical protein